MSNNPRNNMKNKDKTNQASSPKSGNKRPSRNDGRSPIVRFFAAFLVVIIIFAMLVTMLPAFVFGDTTGDRPPLVIDEAGLLTAEEKAELEEGLEKFREEQDFDIVVLTVPTLNGYDVVDYADMYYDDNGYGGGEEHDGCLILVSTEYRDWTMITTGYGITAITDYSLDQIEEEILPYLSGGQYAEAFKKFADHVAYCLREARAGNIVDEYIYDDTEGGEEPSPAGSDERREYPLATNVGAAGIIGILASWLTNSRKKAQLKSVRYRNKASDYVRRDSLRLTENRERFLYSSVSRVPISRADDDDDRPGHFGGSTIHFGPSGIPHGGGHSGKF